MNRIYIILIILLAAMLLLIAFAVNIPRDVLFWVIEGLGVLVIVFLFYFYRRVMRPIHIIGTGMELLREQDFSSRLRSVGEPEADRIVDIFNRMMGELKEGRLRLRERNHLLDLLVEVSPMGVVMLDFDGHITSLNPAARHMLCCSDGVIGCTMAELDGELAMKVSTLEDGQTTTFNTNDAHIFRCTRRSFLDSGFQHPFILIESLTQEVMAAEREAYGKVIRMISHEVNNTMASVSCIMETVGDELRDIPSTDELRKALRACVDRSGEMSAFITRFADVVKIPEPELRSVSLDSLVTANLHFMESLCSVHGIELHAELCGGDPLVAADVALMAQVLVNIVKNSVESIMEVSADNEGYKGSILISTSCLPLQIVVTDNGTGISNDTSQKLFTPFFSTKPHGHGIGLLLIREILTRHNCSFSLKTDADGMTRFKIEF